jgi:CheY-like chemotaxis protein
MRKILLADDSLTIQKVVELTFMDEDYEVQSVRSAEEARARLEAGRPDIVIADIHVPGASGYEICREAKERYEGVPVLLLIGTFESVDEGDLARCGAEAHLKKPFDSQELLHTVEELTSRAAASAGERDDLARPAGFEGTAHVEGESTIAGEMEREEGGQDAVGRPTGLETSAWAEAAPAPVPEVPATTATTPVAAAVEQGTNGGAPLSEDDVERIARRVVEILGDRIVREVAWDVVPDLAEVVVKERLRELEAQVE